MDSTLHLGAALPNEVLEEVFRYLSPIELSRLSQVSRSLYQISTRSLLWEKSYFAFWREEVNEEEDRRSAQMLRRRRRIAELREIARTACDSTASLSCTASGIQQTGQGKPRRKSDSISLEQEKRSPQIPFPIFFSSDESTTRQTLSEAPQFYRLFLTRIQVDDEVLGVIREQCCNSGGWLGRVERLVSKYGNEAKDVLHALVACQQRMGDDPMAAIAQDPYIESPDFPTALQVRLPSTSRSKTHHLSLLHYGRELLEHLQRREAIQGFTSLRQDVKVQPSTTGWLGVSAENNEGIGDESALLACQRTKDFENAISWHSMFRGGEGQEIAEELDVLATSCALYLASCNITLSQDPRTLAAGITHFMRSRNFLGMPLADPKLLSSNYLHLCLDENGRETLPMTLVVIFCAIASRLGLHALPTNTPSKVLAVVEVPASQQQYSWSSYPALAAMGADRRGMEPETTIPRTHTIGPTRFWVDVHDNGRILDTDGVKAILARMRYEMHDVFVSPSTSLSACLRAARNIIVSVQGAQVTARFLSTNTSSRLAKEGAETNLPPRSEIEGPDKRFDRIVSSSNVLFPPRRTYLTNKGPYLNSPFWSSFGPAGVEKYEGRYPRLNNHDDFEQQASMHGAANALTRLSDELGLQGSVWCSTLIELHFPLDALISREESSSSSAERRPTAEDGRAGFENLVKSMQEIEAGPTPKRRVSPQHDDLHRVGTLFVHRVQGYKAVTLDWDEECRAPPDWIRTMSVDSLPNGGRSQPFYQSMVEDGSTRYVAHCNIIPATMPLSGAIEQNATSRLPAPDRVDVSASGQMSLLDVEDVTRQRGIGKLFRSVVLQQDGHLLLINSEQGQCAFPDG